MTEQLSLSLLSRDYVNHKSSEGNKLSGYSQVPHSSFPLIPFYPEPIRSQVIQDSFLGMAPLVPSPGFHHPCLDYHSTSQVTITPRPHSSTSSRNMSLVAQVCPSLCDPMDCSPPGSSAHGILQARILEWVAICFSRGDHLHPGVKPRSSALQADSLLSSHIIHIMSLFQVCLASLHPSFPLSLLYLMDRT